VSGIASFHLQRDRSAVRAVARLGTDRLALRHVPGLRFWRLLGTGHGSDTSPGADLHRTALFAVWDDEEALDAHLASPAVRAREASPDRVESYVVRLRGLGGHGTWRGVAVLDEIDRASEDPDGPVAVLTRADVRLRHWRTFATAGRPVSAELQGAPGLLRVAGVGEAPVGRQATFSLWRSAADVRRFAHHLPEHAAVVRRTRAEGWYGEELFARFRPFAGRGTWDGGDPLAG
jgi:heme-degrading monooxygenase HmoA